MAVYDFLVSSRVRVRVRVSALSPTIGVYGWDSVIVGVEFGKPISHVGLATYDPTMPAVAQLKPLIGTRAENQLMAFDFLSSRVYPKPAPRIDCWRERYTGCMNHTHT